MQWFKVVGTKNCVFVSLREQLKFDLLTLPSRNPCNQDTFRLYPKLSQMMIQMSVHQFVPVFITHLSPKRMMHYRNYRSSFGKFLNTSYKLCLAFSKSEWEVIRNSFAVGLFFPKSLLNPESALDFVAKLNYSIKARAHGLFLKKEYFCILNLKMGVSSWFWRRI